MFRIATFVNDAELYKEMRASFEAAGFVVPIARYTIETGDPYEAVTRLGTAYEPYVILVHQDVRCDQGDTAGKLTVALEQLTALDDSWVVAGNAGGTKEHGLVRHVSDPHGTDWTDGLPARVVTLDENLLILRTARSPHCSERLSGFHLYGSDVCLNAERDGSSCYVVDFRASHLSPGSGDGLDAAAERFAARWSEVRPRYLATPSRIVALARPRPVRRLMMNPRVRLRLI